MMPSYVNETQVPSLSKVEVLLPEKLKNKNMVIEIEGGGKQIFKTYYSTNFSLKILEQYGELKVTNKQTSKPLPKVYVKVFTRKVGNIGTFFRDGYTDVRGKFEFAKSSTGALDGVKKFAILVMSEKHGSMVKEALPPGVEEEEEKESPQKGK